MEKIIRKFGRLATRTAKALHDCEEGTHRFHSHPSYYKEGVTHEVVSISVRRGGFDIFLQEGDPCGLDSIYFPVREHMRRSAELLANPARHDDMLATLNSEIRILLTFLKEYIEDTLDSINEELKGHPEDEPNGWEPDFEKRLVSFEFTVMNDKYWTDIPFDTLKAEYGLEMAGYEQICEELRKEEETPAEKGPSSRTVIVCWPSVQMLMDCEGFREHSALCNSEELYREYGDSAYAVDKNWLETLPAETLDKVFSLHEAYPGPDVDFGSLEKTDGLMTI